MTLIERPEVELKELGTEAVEMKNRSGNKRWLRGGCKIGLEMADHRAQDGGSLGKLKVLLA